MSTRAWALILAVACIGSVWSGAAVAQAQGVLPSGFRDDVEIEDLRKQVYDNGDRGLLGLDWPPTSRPSPTSTRFPPSTTSSARRARGLSPLGPGESQL